MKLTIESTSAIVRINGQRARVWKGHTEKGVAVKCIIYRVTVLTTADAAELEAALEEQPAPQLVRDLP